jgi:hypothetical protein
MSPPAAGRLAVGSRLLGVVRSWCGNGMTVIGATWISYGTGAGGTSKGALWPSGGMGSRKK